MKKLITMMLALAILLVPALMTDQKVYADTYGNFEYDLYTDEATGVESVSITSYTGSDMAVIVPAAIDGKAVTKIGDYAFSGNTSIMQVTLPDSVKLVDYCAFYDCTSLTSISLGNGVEELGAYAFECCESLRSITLPSSLKKIGGGAFNDSSLQTITVPDSVTEMGSNVFSGCGILKTAVIGSGLKIYPDSMFYDCEVLTSVTMNGQVTSIGSSAFSNCKALKSISLPSTLLRIGESAFSNCQALEAIEIPASVLKIEDNTFRSCTNLQSAVMGEGVVSIGYCAFEYCENLESINLPQDLVSVDTYAFYGCDALKYVFFKGTKEQWEGMIIKDYNDPLKNAAAHFNAIGHAYKEKVVAPTCTAKGYTAYTCACGHSYKDKYTNAVGHNYSAIFTIDKKATMKVNGSKSRHCTACDATTDVTTIYAASNVKLSYASTTYTGKAKAPTVMVKDSKGNTISDDNYTVKTPAGRINAGTYTYTVTFKNEYSASETKTLKLTIKKADMTGIKAKGKTATYDGKSHTITLSGVPDGAKVTYKTSANGTYKSTKPTRTKAGKTTVYYKITKDNYNTVTGTAKITVNAKKLGSASLAKTTYVYTGKAIKSAVTVKDGTKKLKKGTDYTVAYKKNTDAGKATVTITGKGNYKGTITKNFTINPKAIQISSVTAAKKGFTVKWKKQTKQVTGYQICYGTSTNKDKGKKVLVKKNTTVSKKITGLIGGKKYNVWIRTYKTVNGTKYYSEWSKVKTVKTKK